VRRSLRQRNIFSINPDECIECGACEAACLVTAIFEESLVPQEWREYIAINANFFKR
jgi:NAD-dependent dihydropyrimidine dehydrogenase PreA subunit